MKRKEKEGGFLSTFIKNITLPSLLFRLSLFSFIWWIIADGDASSWWIGLPAVLLSTMISLTLFTPVHFSYLRFMAFIPIFLIYSVKGAFDIALRALHPRLPIAPDMIKYTLSLPEGLPRVFMVNLVNLIPGTLTAQLEKDELTIHVMDIRQDFKTELITLEEQVAKIFSSPESFYKGEKYNATI